MNKTSGDLFKKSLDKAYSQPGIQLNQSTMIDNMKWKQSFKEEKLEGGKSDNKTFEDLVNKHKKHGKSLSELELMLKKQLDKGIRVEMEHTKNKSEAKEIAMDHLFEDPQYYTKLKKIETKENLHLVAKRQFAKDIQNDPDFIEFKKRAKYKDKGHEFSFGIPNVSVGDQYIKKTKHKHVGKEEPKEATGSGSSGAYEGPLFGGDSSFVKKSQSETPKLKENVEKVEAKEATGSGSVGGYSTPAMWAKSTKKKDWGPSRKTQLPGGSFVKVKKKCTKFPYCNQGDINALKITKNESVKEAIKNIAKKYNISENLIINILENQYSKHNKR